VRTKPGKIVVKKEPQVYSPKRGDVESENNIGKILKFRYIDSERARGRQSGRLLHRANRRERENNSLVAVDENNQVVGLDENGNGEESPASPGNISCATRYTLTTTCSTPSHSPSPAMDTIQDNIRLLLEGRPYEELHEFCDFSLRDQNDATAAKGVPPTAPSDFVPVVKKSVCYIVAAVLFNDKGEVLMMQEAKSSCAGQWYLPAGRMEAGEDIAEATRREVKEETGLDFELSTLILVESAAGSWYRFVVTGTVVGGKLKTPADADSESLQAKWIDDLSELTLRASDVLPLIERGRQYHSAHTGSRPEPWHHPVVPALRPHNKLLLRTVIVIRKKTNNRLHVLISEKTAAHLPVCEINPSRSIHSTLKKFMTEIFGADTPHHKPHGLLSLEHSGRPAASNDGSCLTLLISMKVPLESVVLIDKYSWLEMERPLCDQLLDRLAKNMTVPLVVIR